MLVEDVGPRNARRREARDNGRPWKAHDEERQIEASVASTKATLHAKEKR